ncbi:hypothetical protein [Curvivirga aplysinae]|uniref:hypothetical protein n=1 Tax=Curvivirga aplysinae TaxID=2529852 RepID=UPI0012BD5A93|nr:hypothetical protein [Curvivirga aplysinae]MTI08603.1 hypothetical protein [Curvivirga aplysinae]
MTYGVALFGSVLSYVLLRFFKIPYDFKLCLVLLFLASLKLFNIYNETEAGRQKELLENQKLASPVYLKGATTTGTFFYGGVRMKGRYLSQMIESLQQAGLKNTALVPSENYSSGNLILDGLQVPFINHLTSGFHFPIQLPVKRNTQQLNLIGYSYGSIKASQDAMILIEKGIYIDHLVLIGSPINENFLQALKKLLPNDRLIILDLNEYEDPLYAGMSDIEIFLSLPKLIYQLFAPSEAIGHYLYIDVGPQGQKMRDELSQRLKMAGVK